MCNVLPVRGRRRPEVKTIDTLDERECVVLVAPDYFAAESTSTASSVAV
jgi:hypothetical protein